MKTIIYVYILIPLVLFSGFLIMVVFNNNIIGYLPPSILAVYPLFPCWPGNGGFDIGGPPSGGSDIQFSNDSQSYHVGQSIDPSIKYIGENFGIGTPDLYLYHGNMTQMRMVTVYLQNGTLNPNLNLTNLTVWHEQGYMLKKGPRCMVTAQYHVDQITQPPRLNSTGWYVLHADFGSASDDKGASYSFYVSSP